MNCNRQYILYKIYYRDELVYIGRTSQQLSDRLRMHFFHTNKIANQLDILQVDKIEYSILETQADMFLYEIYLINLYHPKLNVDDNAEDDLSSFIVLPELEFYIYNDPLIEKWKEKMMYKIINVNDFLDDDAIDIWH